MQRAITFERDCMIAACDRVDEGPLGLWTRSSAHPKMWMLNQVHVIGPQPSLTTEAFLAELDRRLEGVEHRRAQVTDDATGRRLAADVSKRDGWTVTPVMVMVLEGGLERPSADVAREVGQDTMRAVDERIVAADGGIPEHDKAVVVEGHAHMRATIPGTRGFVGTREGVDASVLTLYCDGRTAQPEDINTLAEHRGHGLASAMIVLAAHEAQSAGSGLVFIVCDAAEGPYPLYASLGFRAAGRYWSFTRPA